ncbi:MAG: hypothetical protein GY936_17990 [Ignavibacteriae bacterium]|nr:hypothetical protein [Ignavibacteriota bacterium]
MKKTTMLLIIICLLPTFTRAQDSTNHYLTLKPHFFQIKEAANYGLVFNGINLMLGYEYLNKREKSMHSYNADFGFGAGFNKGVSFNWHLKPVDLYYGWSVSLSENTKFYIGPYFSTNYYYQLYPELQSGHSFWFTFIDAGPKIVFEFPIKSKTVVVSFANSIVGLGSRPVLPANSESHFYTLNFGDWVKNLHSNFEFGSFNLLNHTTLSIEVPDISEGGLSLAYEFEYFGYFETPTLNYSTHSINIKFNL